MVDPVSIVAGRPRGHLSETLWDEPWWQQTEEAAIGGRTNLHLLRWSHSPSGRCFFLYGLILLVSSNGHSMYIYNYIYTVYIQMFVFFIMFYLFICKDIIFGESLGHVSSLGLLLIGHFHHAPLEDTGPIHWAA